MAVTLEEISTITAKGQTTVPKAVRQALGVDYGGRVAVKTPLSQHFLAFLPATSRQIRRPSGRCRLTLPHGSRR
jgi:bifunctional DNA-binding transcriptional regulator/antitoxin component of YhaV-PrlF toxin-antitoxin module